MDTMDCTDIKALLSALADDELDHARRHVAERHLAECRDCRLLLDQAEALDQAIVADTAGLTAEALPDGFEDAVLGRTIFRGSLRPYGRMWTTWVGWVAAAASLALAITIWRVDRSGGADASPPRHIDIARIPTTPPDSAPWLSGEVAMGMVSSDAPAPARAESGPAFATITGEDADVLYAASLLLETLLDAEATSFAEVEEIRQVAEYDQILPRLAAARRRLSATDQTAVLAAESILLRVVRGPISREDVAQIRQTLQDLDLAGLLNAISERPARGHSA